MSLPAPNSSLVSCPSDCRTKVVRRGFYSWQNGRRRQRFRCTGCKRSFSEEIFFDSYREKRRDLRRPIFLHLNNGASQRPLARILLTSRTTLVRKFVRMGELCRGLLVEDNLKLPRAQGMQFDDLETHEHTKCKPLSVTIAVENRTRRILGLRVSVMPAKGALAAISRKKYGPRPDLRSQGRDELFREIKPLLEPGCPIFSDKNPHYGPDVKRHFPGHSHITSKGRRGCVTGQGELKSGGYDPLFCLNHSYAMFRAHMNRLFRRTWNTSKLKSRLELHLAMYAVYHNRYVIHHPSR